MQHTLTAALRWSRRAFDNIATWVAQLSWWKFFLFAILLLAGGGILQETLFDSGKPKIVHERKKDAKDAKDTKDTKDTKDAKNSDVKVFEDDEADIRIDKSGIYIRKKPPVSSVPQENTTENISENTGVHITLPPGVGEEVTDAIEEAVNEAAEEKVASYRHESSTWFMNFILLLLLGLFGTKALMGGKKRAEARAQAANAAAEREMLQRQVSEAKMQMMQAQVEPHFLFNTLASVEHLIETDPPRASAMQRRLIQYLRAVLPQMRETTAATTLGREADLVRAYLDLLKMRMEERLHADIDIPEGLRSAAFPPMMLQPLVENAIKHGLERKPEGGTLRIIASVANGKLRVTVADNGLGFGAVPSDGTGLGLQSIRERLKLLHAEQAQFVIAPNSPTGVCATIEVPYQSMYH